jgi:phosphoribosylanthranilate isomerase
MRVGILRLRRDFVTAPLRMTDLPMAIMTWVKICGTTNLDDALTAVDAGADAVGFVFYEKSPRCVTVETARQIVEKLPESVEKIGVFAGRAMENAVPASLDAGFDAIQVYPMTHKPQAEGIGVQRCGLRIYLALPITFFLGEGNRNVVEFSKERSPGVFDTVLLDSGNSQQPGGTGRSFDWRQASSAVKELSLRQKIVIAGGLTPENVNEALGVLNPFGVDVVSGVEASPGKKDPEKVRAFVRAVRQADEKVG